MDTSQKWDRLLAAVRAPGDRAAALELATAAGLDVSPTSVGCSITVRTGGRYRTAASANAVSLARDEAQYEAGIGPCVAAAGEGTRHRIDVMPGADRFAGFRAAALRHGVHSSLSVPLTGPAALNLYASAPAAFAPDRAHAVADLLARCVAEILLPGAPPADPGRPAAERERAAGRAGARTARAVHAVMDAEGLTRADAFARLVQRSRAERRSLHAVVDDVLGGAS